MSLNMSGTGGEDSSSRCGFNMTEWEKSMEKMYTYFYLLLFIPGLLLNTTALWVLCRHIRCTHKHTHTHIREVSNTLWTRLTLLSGCCSCSKKTKAVIFMINLAFADLAHILSLPLRIYYYFTHTWPFGKSVCLLCFYLKYLNMYAAIVFLVSAQ